MTVLWKLLWLFLFLSLFSEVHMLPGPSSDDVLHYKEKVKEMFDHAFDSYMKHAYPLDELKPLSCSGKDTWGSYSLTLIDSLDTLVVMGKHEEFRRSADAILNSVNFNQNVNASVFETNIRVVGGLLSAHLLAKRGGLPVPVSWPCDGPLLRAAERAARRILPAFDTPTGMPYGTVNLRHGVPVGETTVTCTAAVGTYILEFTALTDLTGDPVFKEVATRALNSLWKHRSSLGLVGNHVDVATGKWVAADAGIGGGIDSYFEYLAKGAILLDDGHWLAQFRHFLAASDTHLQSDDWFVWVNMFKGTLSLPIFQSLDAFLPGTLTLIGDVERAESIFANFYSVWRQYGGLPEFYNLQKAEAESPRNQYPLRPELAESAYYLWRATRKPFYRQAAIDIVESIERIARVPCGYATVRDIRDHTLEDRMESFLLAETFKYLYLIFDDDNFMHKSGAEYRSTVMPDGVCLYETDAWLFNTEAHPIDMAALRCCSAQRKEDDRVIKEEYESDDLLRFFKLDEDPDQEFEFLNFVTANFWLDKVAEVDLRSDARTSQQISYNTVWRHPSAVPDTCDAATMSEFGYAGRAACHRVRVREAALRLRDEAEAARLSRKQAHRRQLLRLVLGEADGICPNIHEDGARRFAELLVPLDQCAPQRNVFNDWALEMFTALRQRGSSITSNGDLREKLFALMDSEEKLAVPVSNIEGQEKEVLNRTILPDYHHLTGRDSAVDDVALTCQTYSWCDSLSFG